MKKIVFLSALLFLHGASAMELPHDVKGGGTSYLRLMRTAGRYAYIAGCRVVNMTFFCLGSVLKKVLPYVVKIEEKDDRSKAIMLEQDSVFAEFAQAQEDARAASWNLAQQWPSFGGDAWFGMLPEEDGVGLVRAEREEEGARLARVEQEKEDARLARVEQEKEDNDRLLEAMLQKEKEEEDARLARVEQQKEDDARLARAKQEEEDNDRLLEAMLQKEKEEDVRLASLSQSCGVGVTPVFVPGLDITPMIGLVQQFSEVCQQQGGLDFNVHALDSFVGNALPRVHQFLNDYFPITRDEKELYGQNLDNLSLIIDDLHGIMQAMSPQQRYEDDLTDKGLFRAFEVLQGQHVTLVPMLVQIYTLINEYAPGYKEYLLSSLISNVNKFKGGECFAGYRNRLVTFLMSFIDSYNEYRF